ncbi:GMP synthase [Vannielia sp. SX4]|uniref:GMP synthase n=1 Tax=Vannielia sp. SX4 TaxID=3463852 RepID=UPI004058C76D
MVAFEHAVARIAVWNLGCFFPAGPEKTENQIEGLALLDAEIVVLVEVNPASYIEVLREGLAAKGLDYQAVLVEQTVAHQHLGILHKQGVEITGKQILDGSEGDYTTGRRAVIADLKVGEFEAHLIAVHLKSGRGAGEQALRDSQCRFIGDYITTYQEQPGNRLKTVLLMGDFNMIPGQDVSNFHHLGGGDVMDFLSCWDLQERFSHILEGGPANLLDGFAISRIPIKNRAYVRGSLRLFPMHWTMDMGRETFREEVSDHLPFTATFKIT